MRSIGIALLSVLILVGVAHAQNDAPKVSGADLAPPGGAAASSGATESKKEPPASASTPKQESKPAESSDAANRETDEKNKQATHPQSSGRVAAFWFIVPGK